MDGTADHSSSLVDEIAVADLTPSRVESLQLPDSVDTLHEMVRHLLLELSDRDRSNEDLRFQLERLKRALYGPRSEKLSDAQLALMFQELTELQAKDAQDDGDEGTPEDEPSPHRRPQRKPGHGRRKLPSHLPREPHQHRPDEADEPCPECGKSRRKIGEEVSEILEYQPASLVVHEHHREKWACPDGCCKIAIAPPAPRPVDKGLCGFGLMAFILTSKYADHLPLNRQVGMLTRHGVVLGTSTLSDWVAQGAAQLEPIVEAMARQLRQAPAIHTDETGIPVRMPDRKHCHKGYLWVYQSLDDLGQAGHCVFVYTPTKHGTGPKDMLGGYTGKVIADAASGFDQLFGEGGATETGCWAHTRRKFYDARSFARADAAEALALIKKLYRIERTADRRKMSMDQRLELRQSESTPIVEEFRQYLERIRPLYPPSSPLGKAITYATNQWPALNTFLEFGLLPMDNNAAERALRAPVVGRKNWMFAGSEDGARRAATLFSLVASCRLHGVDPWAYFDDVLRRVQTHPAKRVNELTPKAWAEARKKAGGAGPDPPS
jgi:transposase